MKKVLIVMTLLVTLLCSSCVTTESVIIQRSKTIHSTVHKEYLNYVEKDSDLLPEQKEIRKNRIKAYGVLLDEAE